MKEFVSNIRVGIHLMQTRGNGRLLNEAAAFAALVDAVLRACLSPSSSYLGILSQDVLEGAI